MWIWRHWSITPTNQPERFEPLWKVQYDAPEYKAAMWRPRHYATLREAMSFAEREELDTPLKVVDLEEQ
jgi:hypothetical protein